MTAQSHPGHRAMKNKGLRRFGKVGLALFIVAGLAPGSLAIASGEAAIPIVKTKTATYTNVTITARTETDLCILHDGGAGNVTFEDLDPEAYASVGYVPPKPATEKLKSMASEQAAKVMQVWQVPTAGANAADPPVWVLKEIDPTLLIILGVVGFVSYLFFCYCYLLICRKAGEPPGLLIWIPILQVFPLLRAARMSGWWVLGMLLPILNIIIPILWCFKIVSARGKSPVWAVCLILPVTNLIALLYLAFSAGEDEENSTSGPTRLPTLAVRTV